MAEMKILDSILPFKCDNPDCGKEYDQDLFAKAILLWGFIFLISEEDDAALIGLTCTECKKTTLKKYRAYVGLTFLDEISTNLKKFGTNDTFTQTQNLKSKWFGQYFSAQHLTESGFIDNQFPRTEQRGGALYSIPQEVTLEKYSTKLQEDSPFTLLEEDIPYILNIENNLSYKALPRTQYHIGFLFSVPDTLNIGLDSMLLDPGHENVNNVLRGMIHPNHSLYDITYTDRDENGKFSEFAGRSFKKKELSKAEKNRLLAANDLLVEEEEHFLTTSNSWERQAFQDNIDNFLNDLKEIRNRIDCELIYRNRLINKYARTFYFKTRTLGEHRDFQKAVQDENDQIENAGGLERWIIGGEPSDPSDGIPARYINGSQLMDKWGMTAYEIVNLIQHKGLGGYDSIFSVSINQNSFSPALIAELTMGDKDNQKNAMQRLQFDPGVIKAFEKRCPELVPEAMDEFKADVVAQETMTPTPKEVVKKCCRETARRIVDQEPDITLLRIIKTDAIKRCFEGTGVDIPGESGFRNWLKGIYKPVKGRRKGS